MRKQSGCFGLLFFFVIICSLMSGESIGEGPAVCGLFLAKYKMCKESRRIPVRVLTSNTGVIECADMSTVSIWAVHNCHCVGCVNSSQNPGAENGFSLRVT